eukprot:2119878-Prymnesium_polylepis.1
MDESMDEGLSRLVDERARELQLLRAVAAVQKGESFCDTPATPQWLNAVVAVCCRQVAPRSNVNFRAYSPPAPRRHPARTWKSGRHPIRL